MQVNFDAEIRLDIGPFIASINKAQAEVAKLAGQIDTLNSKSVNVKVNTSSTGNAGASSSARMAASREEISLQKEADAQAKAAIKERQVLEKQAAAEKRAIQKEIDTRNAISAKTEWQAEQMRVKARDASLKDHATISRRFDDTIAQRDKESKAFSSSIRARMQEQATAAQQAERNLARERYALYDVAAAYTAIAGAAAAGVVATAGTAINFEKAFVSVLRTTDFVSLKIGEAAENMKYELKSLASEIPVTFGQITEIATIGNQLGIAQGALASFTETVAKFSATTGVSVDSTAMSFGRIGELLGVPAEDFEKLGSSIAFAGVNAVATEAQILSVTKEIATTAKMANFLEPDIIGLATALSSLGIAPEAARGSIIRTFAGINAAISEGGQRLEDYSRIAGMPAEQFASTWQSNGKEAFDSFLAGLQNLSNDGENLDTVLRNLGMVNVRDIQTIQKLGDNYGVWASSIKDANQAFDEGTFLGESYGKIQDTVASKLQLLGNSWSNLLDSIGQGAIEDSFKALLDSVNSFLIRLNEIARSPVGKVISTITVVLSALAAVFFAVNAVSALTQASLRAFATAQTALIATTNTSTLSMRLFDSILLKTGISARISAGAMNNLKVAMGAVNTLITAAKWLVVIQAVTIGLSELSTAFTPVQDKAEALIGGFSGLQEALTADYGDTLARLGSDAAVSTAILKGEVNGATVALDSNQEAARDAAQAYDGMRILTGETASAIDATTGVLRTQNVVLGDNYDAWVRNKIAQSPAFQRIAQDKKTIDYLKSVGFSLEKANNAAKVGTLDTYMKNLVDAGKKMNINQPMILKEDWWMGFDNPLQQIQDLLNGSVNEAYLLGGGFGEAAEAAATTADETENLNEELENAGKTLRTVADYANDLRGVLSRAFEIRFGQQQSLDGIASGWNSINEEARGAREAVADANAEINELNADRSVLEYQLSVAERYGDEKRAAIIRAKLSKIDSSMSKATDKLTENTAILSRETEGNTNIAIENRNAILGQLGSYTDLIEMYSKTGLKGEALEAKVRELKEEFIKQAIEAGYSREELEPYVKTFDDLREAIEKVPRNVDTEFNSNVSAAQQAVNEYIAKIKQADTEVTTTFTTEEDNKARIKAAIDDISFLREEEKMIRRSGGDTVAINKLIEEAINRYRSIPGFASYVYGSANGGLITGPGTGTSDSIPRMLSNGEYVIKASAVGAYGVDFMNALNQQKVGSFTSSSSMPQGGAGSSVIHLSPEDRALLRAAIDRPVNLYTENSKIASSANAGNVMLAQRGAR